MARCKRLRRPQRRCREVAQQLQAVGARLLGVELHAVERLAARPRTTNSLAVVGGAEHVVAVGHDAARTSARGRRRTRPAGPSVSARLPAASATAFQPMCGTFRPGRRAASTVPCSRPRPSAPPSSRSRTRTAAACPRQMPSTGTPAVEPLARAARRARAAQVAASPSGTRPRRAAPRRRPRGSRRGRRSRSGSAPTCSSAFSTERRLPIP